MKTPPLSDQTAIVGIGWSEFSRDSGTSVINLAAKASLNAIEDAGLEVGDIDGIITFWWQNDTIYPRDLAQALGITRCNYEVFNGLGGSWSAAAVLTAAMAVYSGICTTVLVYRALNGRSGKAAPAAPERAAGRSQFTLPFGVTSDAANFGHYATAHMARYGTTSLDFAHLAVTQRKHAMLNTKAIMRTPMTIEDHQASRWVVYPYRLLDCCLVSDGAAAIVVTSARRARRLARSPVYILNATGGGTHGPEEQWTTVGQTTARRLYDGVGVSAKDVDVAEVYDPFTGMCLIHVEDFGLTEKGAAGAWVRAGENGLDGETPVNTHGGLLSEAYVHGMNHVVEAVQQLRPGGVIDDLCEGEHTFDRAQCRQVRSPTIGLVAGERGDSALLLRRD